MEATAVLPICGIFIALKNLSSSDGFQSANFGSSGKHDNHYTTEGDCLKSFC
jgi:hypothetical protein